MLDATTQMGMTMNKFVKIAVASAALAFGGAVNAATVTAPTYVESFSGVAPTALTETFNLGFATTFDVAFSVTTTGYNGDFDYLIEGTDGTFLGAGTLIEIFNNGFVALLGGIATFAYDDDFIVTLTPSDPADSASLGFTVTSPSANIPLPAGVFLLGGALAALGVARRKAA